jgi:hypothetical protein
MTLDNKQDKRFARIREDYRFTIMLVSLICMMIIEPFLYDYPGAAFIINIIFSVIILSSIYAVSYRKKAALFAVILAAPVLVINWSSPFIDQTWYPYVRHIFSTCFFILIIILILDFIFRQVQVSREILFAAIVVYMLLGLMWAVIFRFLEICQPGSFLFPHGLSHDSHDIFLYYSFVTLTTLGYGDISPISAPARSLAILEAIIGQMYVAVLIARLMGTHISQSMQKEQG